MNWLRRMGFALTAIIAGVSVFLIYAALSTRAEITGLENLVRRKAAAAPMPSAAEMAELPYPVRRYFDFTFPDGIRSGPDYSLVEMEARGDFRRPLMTEFGDTTARQVVNIGRPDMAFSADTPIVGPLWAIAYDVYIDGTMTMRARVLSAFTVVEEDSSPLLDRISLRRWLLESPAFPMALLPGGPVTWETVDDKRARAVVRAFGIEASMVATFRADGSLERMDAEKDGDLTTPYHGSGEHTLRTDYKLVQGVRVPTGFVIARVAGGKIYPFWRGRINSIRFSRE